MPDKQLTIHCGGTDEAMVFNTWTAKTYDADNYPYTAISFYVDQFYARQVSIRQKLWDRVKLATAILLGKEDQLEELMLTSADDHERIATYFSEVAAQMRTFEEDKS